MIVSRVITGPRFVLEALRANTPIEAIYAEPHRADDSLTEAARAASIRIEERPREELDKLTQGARHQGVVAIASDYPYASMPDLLRDVGEGALVVALDEITDPHNVGAIVRSAVAFGADGVLIGKHRSAQVTPAVVRASAGATEHARIIQVTNLQKALIQLKDEGFWIIGLDGAADQEFHDVRRDLGRVVLVIGAEDKGLKRLVRQRCDMIVRIPLAGPIESLNASVAAAIAIYELSRLQQESRT